MIVSLQAVGQDYPRKEIDIENFIQDIFGQQDEDINYEDVYESLFQLYTHPLNLNTATRDELAATYVLSEEQLNHFFAYRKTAGKLLSIYELQAIPGFDLPTIYKLLPFVDVNDLGLNSDSRSLWKRIASEPNHYLLLRYSQVLEQKKGYSPADTSSSGEISQRYAGPPQQVYVRYRVSHIQDFSFGFTVEKDAGEQLIWQPSTKRYGMDFYSIHAQLQNKGRWKNILLGDYQIGVGQGLLLSAGFAVGKGAETITTVRRNQLGIRPYTSVLESGFFRGAAATYSAGKFDITGFYSRTSRDGNVITGSDTLIESDEYTQSLQVSGFHRTPKEISAKGNLGEQVLGGNVVYNLAEKNLQVGGTMVVTQYSVPLLRKPTSYNQFEFNGRNNLNIGIHYSYLWQNFNLFGEAARSQSGGIGFISGLIGSLTTKVELAMVYRNYARNFHSLYGNAFGENTRNINEKGMYWGIKYIPHKKLLLSAYYDRFSFPWLKFRVDAPSQGYEYMGRITYKPTKTILLYAQYREEMKELNQADNTTPIDFPVPAIKRNYVFNIDYPAAKFISLKSRVQGSSYRQSNAPTFGYAIIQDITVDVGKLKVSTRFALFETDNYDNRQYVYEKDVLYAFSIPAYFDRGTRNYVLLQYQVNKKLDLWLRYARTSLRDEKTISSGLEEINQPHKSEVKVQVRYKF
ncbi:ComEA family DNA-binding protein [Rhodocytophaga rosea]|uniref:ComEA family DNA-binding protein n=1 Tax=Rhodocytophaga rosea TaxID=2704465 RepID=UPI001E56BEEF|nr:helix-hairpin-helix domain-containing protein [Rhodocytophaga rosea]